MLQVYLPFESSTNLRTFSTSPTSAKIWTHVYAVVTILLVLTGLLSIIVWLTHVNKQNVEPQVVYVSLFEVVPLEEKLHP